MKTIHTSIASCCASCCWGMSDQLAQACMLHLRPNNFWTAQDRKEALPKKFQNETSSKNWSYPEISSFFYHGSSCTRGLCSWLVEWLSYSVISGETPALTLWPTKYYMGKSVSCLVFLHKTWRGGLEDCQTVAVPTCKWQLQLWKVWCTKMMAGKQKLPVLKCSKQCPQHRGSRLCMKLINICKKTCFITFFFFLVNGGAGTWQTALPSFSFSWLSTTLYLKGN